MSELTTCNYCNWISMKQRGYRKATKAEARKLWQSEAQKEGFVQHFGAGVVVVNKNGKFAAWMMELPNHCCC